VKVEHLPWAQGQRRLTQAYAWFLATWAKRMSWTEVAKTFRTSWENEFRLGRDGRSPGPQAYGSERHQVHRTKSYGTKAINTSPWFIRLMSTASGFCNKRKFQDGRKAA